LTDIAVIAVRAEFQELNCRKRLLNQTCEVSKTSQVLQLYPLVILLRAISNPPIPALRSSMVEGSGNQANDITSPNPL
jgi:hypothetical protein